MCNIASTMLYACGHKLTVDNTESCCLSSVINVKSLKDWGSTLGKSYKGKGYTVNKDIGQAEFPLTFLPFYFRAFPNALSSKE